MLIVTSKNTFALTENLSDGTCEKLDRFQAWISDEIEDLPSGSQTKQARTLVVKNKDLQLGKSSNEMVFSSHVWLLEGHDKTNLPSKNFMDFRFAHQKGRQQNGGVEPVPCYSKNVSSTSCDMPSGGNTAHLFYGWSYIQVVWGMVGNTLMWSLKLILCT